jgi:hypothetical protein
MFWSATDGTDGQTSTNQTLNQVVGGSPLTLTAWYLPPGGFGPGGGPGFLDDAFSDALGDFVDDTFVTCTSDGSLTNEANVVGDISTAHEESLRANASIHTGEGFEHWIAVAESGQQQPSINGEDVTLHQNTSGVAIAAYHKSHLSLPKGVNEEEGWVLLGGITRDGGGYQFPIGHPGGGGPVGPWGPYIARAAKAAALGQLSQGIKGAAEVQRIAANEALQAAEQLNKQVER